MNQYLTLLRTLVEAPERKDRTGVGTRGVFGYQMRFPLYQGFPLLTTKKLFLKGIIHELLWFLRGDTNVKYLQEAGVKIWDEWADADGNLGPVYGFQWRQWPKFDAAEGKVVPVDQIANLVKDLRSNPFSRRHMVSAWNPADIPDMKLPPCHCLFQCYVREAHFIERAVKFLGREDAIRLYGPSEAEELEVQMDAAGVPRFALDLQLYQRSADTFLGVPFNIASYALLTMMLAQVSGMVPGEFIWTGGDVHLYSNHMDQAKEQLSRYPYRIPTIHINPEVTDIFGFSFDDFRLAGYEAHPRIKAEVAV